MKRIGIFGGTFDPLHFGHLNLAIHLLEKHRLDQVLFCPVYQSPFKKHQPQASAEHRMQMLYLALKDVKSFSVLDLEVRRKGISYTIDTLRDVAALYRKKEEPVELFLLLASDAIEHFSRWKESEKILELAKPLIGSRLGEIQEIHHTCHSKKLCEGITPTPIMEISSTEIRNRLSQNLYCGHLVPLNILDYIREHRLYSLDK